jgi:hypothetical protein
VLDLGIAKLIGYDVKETDPNPASTMGTAAYMAPERLEAKPAGTRADTYALGVIAYECLAGHHPLAPDGDWPSLAEVAHRALAYLPPPLKKVPPELSSAVECAMQKNPARRYEAMRDLEQVLRRVRDQLLLEQTPEATPSGAARSRIAGLLREGRGGWQSARARLSLKALLLAAGVALIGVLSFVLWKQNIESRPPASAVRAAELGKSTRALAEFAEVNSTWFMVVGKKQPPPVVPQEAAIAEPLTKPALLPVAASVPVAASAPVPPKAPSVSRGAPVAAPARPPPVTKTATRDAATRPAPTPRPAAATPTAKPVRATRPKKPATKSVHILPGSGL